MKKDASYIEFPIPAGLDLTGLEEGEEKEVLALIRKKGGAACLISVDGVELSAAAPSNVEDYPAEEEDAYAQYSARAKESLI